MIAYSKKKFKQTSQACQLVITYFCDLPTSPYSLVPVITLCGNLPLCCVSRDSTLKGKEVLHLTAGYFCQGLEEYKYPLSGVDKSIHFSFSRFFIFPVLSSVLHICRSACGFIFYKSFHENSLAYFS